MNIAVIVVIVAKNNFQTSERKILVRKLVRLRRQIRNVRVESENTLYREVYKKNPNNASPTSFPFLVLQNPMMAQVFSLLLCKQLIQ